MNGSSVLTVQILTVVTADAEGSTMQHGSRRPPCDVTKLRTRSSYFGVKVGAEPSHEVIGVVAASRGGTHIFAIACGQYLALVNADVAGASDSSA